MVLDKEDEKRRTNGPRCLEEGWECVPLAVDSYGRWGVSAHSAFDTVANRLSVRTKVSFATALSSIYHSLGVVLVRFNARAILARQSFVVPLGAREVQLLASSS